MLLKLEVFCLIEITNVYLCKQCFGFFLLVLERKRLDVHICALLVQTHTHTHIKFTHTYRHTNTHRNTDQRELVQSYSCVVKMVIVTHDGDDGDNMTSLWRWTSLLWYSVINKKCYVTSKFLQVIIRTCYTHMCVWERDEFRSTQACSRQCKKSRKICPIELSDRARVSEWCFISLVLLIPT